MRPGLRGSYTIRPLPCLETERRRRPIFAARNARRRLRQEGWPSLKDLESGHSGVSIHETLSTGTRRRVGRSLVVVLVLEGRDGVAEHRYSARVSNQQNLAIHNHPGVRRAITVDPDSPGHLISVRFANGGRGVGSAGGPFRPEQASVHPVPALVDPTSRPSRLQPTNRRSYHRRRGSARRPMPRLHRPTGTLLADGLQPPDASDSLRAIPTWTGRWFSPRGDRWWRVWPVPTIWSD